MLNKTVFPKAWNCKSYVRRTVPRAPKLHLVNGHQQQQQHPTVAAIEAQVPAILNPTSTSTAVVVSPQPTAGFVPNPPADEEGEKRRKARMQICQSYFEETFREED